MALIDPDTVVPEEKKKTPTSLHQSHKHPPKSVKRKGKEEKVQGYKTNTTTQIQQCPSW